MKGYTLNAEGNLESFEPSAIFKAVSTEEGSFWLDVEHTSTEELRSLLGPLELTPFALRRLCDTTKSSHVIPLNYAIILEFRILPDSVGSGISFITFLLLKNRVVTILESDDPSIKSPFENFDQIELTDSSPSGIFCSLLLHVVEGMSDIIRDFRTKILEMDKRMENNPASVSQAEIIRMKDRLFKAVAVAEEQLSCLESLNDSLSDVLDLTNLKGTRSHLIATARGSERMAGRLEKRLNALRQRYDAIQQDRINHRLAILTVLSAIFLPLTLFAGIWGMNFTTMPELSWEYSYPAALILMGGTAVGMLYYFWKKGWFKSG